MATPDFSKIWGSNGDVTYKFTDDNYLTGWKFIEDVPPSRGMFDAYFKGTDEKFKFLNDSFNAEKTKALTIDDAAKPTSNTAQLLATLSGLATMIKGAKGTSTWRDTPPTTLAQVATLIGNLSSGSDVTWSGKKFTNAKLGISGLMDTNGYVSFGPNFGGLIIQWVTVNPRVTENSKTTTITLPIAFPTQHLCTILSDTSGTIAAIAGNDEGAKVNTRTLTGFIVFAAWSSGLNQDISALSIGL